MDEKTLYRLVETGEMEPLRGALEQEKLMNLSGEAKINLPKAAARAGQAEALRFLCERAAGVELNPDAEGRSLLHDAAASGDAETVRFVMDTLGYLPQEGDCRGETPMDVAFAHGHAEALALMEQRAGFRYAEAYRNPVRRGFYPDPSVVRMGEWFYLVNSSFHFFPCLPISRSKDLLHWQMIGHAVERLEWSGIEGLDGGHGYWAPDISWHDRRFWVVATLRRPTPPYRLQMLTSALSPEGPWEKPVFLPINGIDPSLYVEDGHWYILTNPGAQLTEIDPAGRLLSEPRLLWYGTDRRKSEGPHLMKKDGWYYLFLAEGGTGDGHMESVARSRSLWGPYEHCPFHPILSRKRSWSFIQRSGHGKPVQLADGRWAMVYLCGRKTDGLTLLGRETAVDPMEWTSEGWPMVNRLRGPSCLQGPLLPSCPLEEDDEWIAPRSDPADMSRAEEEEIVLRGGADPHTVGPCSVLVHRQRELRAEQTLSLRGEDVPEGMLAGLCGYYDEQSFYLFGVQRGGGRLTVMCVEQVGEERRETALGEAEAGQLTLKVRVDGIRRELNCGELCISLSASYLADEGLRAGKRFTGATLGVFAVGAGSVTMRYTENQRA